MFPVWLAALFGAIMMAYIAVDVPMQEAEMNRIKADVAATNFVAYRNALQRYIADNPAANGVIQDSSLAAYWPPGYIHNPLWRNLVSGSTLYVYSPTEPVPNMLNAIHSKSRENLLVGKKDAVTGRLKSYKGIDTGIVLPAAIPNGAIVVVGI